MVDEQLESFDIQLLNFVCQLPIIVYSTSLDEAMLSKMDGDVISWEIPAFGGVVSSSGNVVNRLRISWYCSTWRPVNPTFTNTHDPPPRVSRPAGVKLHRYRAIRYCRLFSTNDVSEFLRSESSTDDSNIAKRRKVDFPIEDEYVVVFADGACENNGKHNAKAGLGVWFSDNHPCNVSEPVKGRPTNNTAEIQACIAAAKIASKNCVKKLCIKTDSQFVINSMTQWITRWKTNSWKLASGGPVKNKEDFMELDAALKQLEDVKWVHIRGHSGIKGNEEADRLARLGASRYVS